MGNEGISRGGTTTNLHIFLSWLFFVRTKKSKSRLWDGWAENTRNTGPGSHDYWALYPITRLFTRLLGFATEYWGPGNFRKQHQSTENDYKMFESTGILKKGLEWLRLG